MKKKSSIHIFIQQSQMHACINSQNKLALYILHDDPCQINSYYFLIKGKFRCFLSLLLPLPTFADEPQPRARNYWWTLDFANVFLSPNVNSRAELVSLPERRFATLARVKITIWNMYTHDNTSVNINFYTFLQIA